jgi:hypothetical protein
LFNWVLLVLVELALAETVLGVVGVEELVAGWDVDFLMLGTFDDLVVRVFEVFFDL